jgi:WD40 repeat protein
MWTRRALTGVAALALACGAQSGASPAAAEPKPRTKLEKPRAAPGRAPAPIGAANADRVKKLWEVAAGGRARAVAIDAALGRAAFASDASVSIHDLATGKQLASAKPCKEILHRSTVFAGGKLLVGCTNGVVRLDPNKLAKLAPPRMHASDITALALAAQRLVVAHRDGIIRLYPLDGSPAREIKVPGPPIDVKSLALTRDGARLAVAWVQGSIWWWETSKPDSPRDLVRHASESDALAWSRDGSTLAEEGAQNQTTLWSFASAPAQSAKIKNGAWVKRIHFSADGKWLVRGGSDGLELAEVAGPRRVALDTRGNVEDVAMDERGALVAAADRDGRLTLWAAR